MSQVRSTPPHLTTMINFYSISIFEWNLPIYYFIFGVISTFYFYILLFSVDRKKKVVHKELLSSSTSPSDVPTDSANVRLYLNLYFVDRREFLKNIVRSKISKKRRILRGKTLIINLCTILQYVILLRFSSCRKTSCGRTS